MENSLPVPVRKRTILFLWIVAIASIIVTFLVVRYKIHPGNGPTALHYTVVTGVDVYGKGTALYQIPAIGLVIIIVNFVLYRFLRASQDFLPFLAALVSAVVSVVLLLSVVFLLQVT